jgi:hypothetical protein
MSKIELHRWVPARGRVKYIDNLPKYGDILFMKELGYEFHKMGKEYYMRWKGPSGAPESKRKIRSKKSLKKEGIPRSLMLANRSRNSRQV